MTERSQLTQEILSNIVWQLLVQDELSRQVISGWDQDSFARNRSLPLGMLDTLRMLTSVSRTFYMAASPHLWRSVDVSAGLSTRLSDFKKRLEAFDTFKHRIARHVQCMGLSFPHYSDLGRNKAILSACTSMIYNLIQEMPKVKLFHVQCSHLQLEHLFENFPVAQQFEVFSFTDLGSFLPEARLETKHAYPYLKRLTNCRYLGINSLLFESPDRDAFWQNILIERTQPFQVVLNNPPAFSSNLSFLEPCRVTTLQMDYSRRNGNISELFQILNIVAAELRELSLDGYEGVMESENIPELPKLRSLSLENFRVSALRFLEATSNWHPTELDIGLWLDFTTVMCAEQILLREGICKNLRHLVLRKTATDWIENETQLFELRDQCLANNVEIEHLGLMYQFESFGDGNLSDVTSGDFVPSEGFDTEDD